MKFLIRLKDNLLVWAVRNQKIPDYVKVPVKTKPVKTRHLLLNLVAAILFLHAVMSMASCTVMVAPDGAKTLTLDGEQVIKILQEK